MFDWLKQFNISVKNKAGLGREWLTLLEEDFSLLNRLKPGLAARALRYVLDDEGMEVLTELRGQKEPSTCFPLAHQEQYGSPVREDFRKKFFKKAVIDDPGFYFRLGMVFDAVYRKMQFGFFTSSTNFENDLFWIHLFLNEISPQRVYYYSAEKIEPYFDFTMMEKILEHAGHQPLLLLMEVFEPVQKQSFMTMPRKLICNLRGFRNSVLQNRDYVIKVLDCNNVGSRVAVLEVFRDYQIDIKPFLENLVAMAVSSSKRVQAAAIALPLFSHPEAEGLLKNHAEHGSTDEKIQAISLLARYYRDVCPEFLDRLAGSEKNEKVLNEIRNRIRLLENAENPVQAETMKLEIPVLPPLDPHQPLSSQVKDAFMLCVDEYNRDLQQYYRQMRKSKYYKPGKEPLISNGEARRIIDNMERFCVTQKVHTPVTEAWHYASMAKLYTIFRSREIKLIHTVRLLVSLHGISDADINNTALSRMLYGLIIFRKRNRFTLQEFAQVLKTIGINPEMIGIDYMNQYNWLYGIYSGMSDDEIWPYFTQHFDLIEEGLNLRPRQKLEQQQRQYYLQPMYVLNSLKALSAFPVIPEQFIPALWEFALNGQQKERPLAMKCIGKIPGYIESLTVYLENGNQDIRQRAALWLKETGAEEAVPALKEALKKEKQEKVKASIMETLERLGAPVADFIDQKEMLKNAEKELKKGIPEKLSWFPWDQLPALHWKESGEQVQQEIITWFIIRAFKLKNPEPDPALRLYCSFFNQQEAAALGMLVLNSWLFQDTKPKYTYEEAMAEAVKNTAQMKASVKQYPQYYRNWDEQAYQKSTFNHLLNVCIGSAIDFKGILAVTAACNCSDAVKPAHDYIKRWYGQRSAQAKALIGMLAWIGQPIAIQVVLSIGRRFRTKSIQEEASAQIGQLAERRGWTTDELADRTVPTAGLDEKGEMVLSYGTRNFIVRLDDNMKLVLFREDGNPLKALPEPNQSDDGELAKAAKKTFSDASKELKQVVQLQKERLYDAMCVKRKWKYQDWNEFLNLHPVVGHFCRRLVWGVFRADAMTDFFRPLPDHTLTDADNNEVTVFDDAEVGLAHGFYMSDDDRKKWEEHFSDYKLTPLFTQFGNELYHLPDEKKDENALDDFRGWMLQSFVLRNVLTKLGYTRGKAEDGGCFFSYHKTFSGLNLQAEIRFSGNTLPEENRNVALLDLCFMQKSGNANDYTDQLLLGDVPPVLLSECRNDMKAAADAGTGFDADWEKQSGF